jgi:hypothetical protein
MGHAAASWSKSIPVGRVAWKGAMLWGGGGKRRWFWVELIFDIFYLIFSI